MDTNDPTNSVSELGTAPERIRAGATLEQVHNAFPGSQIIEGVLVMESDAVYADTGGAEVKYIGLTPEQAARRYVDTGDCGENESTDWIDVYTYRIGYDEAGDEVMVDRDTHTISLAPDEPNCISEGGHDWQSPYELLGGIAENPGVWGHGGGVITRTVCAHCGKYRIVDTWAQRPDTGEEGLESIRYEDADEDSLAWVGSSENE